MSGRLEGGGIGGRGGMASEAAGGGGGRISVTIVARLSRGGVEGVAVVMGAESGG